MMAKIVESFLLCVYNCELIERKNSKVGANIFLSSSSSGIESFSASTSAAGASAQQQQVPINSSSSSSSSAPAAAAAAPVPMVYSYIAVPSNQDILLSVPSIFHDFSKMHIERRLTAVRIFVFVFVFL